MAAKQLFLERGFHGTAMADLAEGAQVSVGAIYRCFSSKSEIIRAIVQDDTEKTLGQLREAIEQVRTGSTDGAVAIEALVFQWLSAQRDALNHEIVAEAHRNAEVADTIFAICSQFREQFRILVKLVKPDLDDMEVEGGAELLLACLFGMGSREFTDPRLDAHQAAAIVTRLFLQGLTHKDAG